MFEKSRLRNFCQVRNWRNTHILLIYPFSLLLTNLIVSKMFIQLNEENHLPCTLNSLYFLCQNSTLISTPSAPNGYFFFCFCFSFSIPGIVIRFIWAFILNVCVFIPNMCGYFIEYAKFYRISHSRCEFIVVWINRKQRCNMKIYGHFWWDTNGYMFVFKQFLWMNGCFFGHQLCSISQRRRAAV